MDSQPQLSPMVEAQKIKSDPSKNKRKAQSIDPGNYQLDLDKTLKKLRTDLNKFNLTTEKTTYSLNHKIAELYERFQNDYKLLFSTEVFDTPIKRFTISPNQLQDRFDPKDVTILNTEACEEVFKAIKKEIASKLEIKLTGPIGIGKSYALLAAVLTLRKEGHLVIYINNPEKWIQMATANEYLIFELIYASLPICEHFQRPKEFEKLVDEDDSLFAWFSLLMQSIRLPEIEKILADFLVELSVAALRAGKKIFLVYDQENTLLRKDAKGERLGDKFPYSLRRAVGNHRIFSASANNENLYDGAEPNLISIFTRMSEKELTSEESEVLYQLCNGNPLEAKAYFLGYANKKSNGQDFKTFCLKYFPERVKMAQENHKKFMLNQKEGFNTQFNRLLAFVDASVDINTTSMIYQIRDIMNKQLMVITDDRSFLESLHPAASKVFQNLRKTGDDVVDALYTILYSKNPFTADTIGRLLEYYIIYVLKEEDNWNETLHFKYTLSENPQQELDFRIINYSIESIAMGVIIPDRVEKNTIFIPESPSYPCVDVLYLDRLGNTLYAMQITVNMENHKSSHGSFEEHYFSQWQKVYGNDLKLQFIWIGGGWKPGRLKLGVQSTNNEITPKSWIINYKQFPTVYFPLFQYLHEDGGVKDMLFAVKIPSIDIFSDSPLRENISEGKFKEICSSYFKHRFPTIKNLVFVYGFINSVIDKPQNQYKWPEKTGFVLFSTAEDMKIFKDNFLIKDKTEEPDIEEFNAVKKMTAMHVKGIRLASINES